MERKTKRATTMENKKMECRKLKCCRSRHSPTSSFYYHVLLFAYLLIALKLESHQVVAFHPEQNGQRGDAAASEIQLLFDQIWNDSKGVVPVDRHQQQQIYASLDTPEILDYWTPIHDAKQKKQSAFAVLDPSTRGDCHVPDHLQRDLLTGFGKQLATMLIERFRPLQNSNLDDATTNKKEEERRRLPSHVYNLECPVRTQSFSSGHWILNQTEFIVNNQYQHPPFLELPLLQTHLILAISLMTDATIQDDEESPLWILLDRDHFPNGTDLRESLTFLFEQQGPLHNDAATVSKRRWWILSYHFFSSTTTTTSTRYDVDPPFCKGMPMVTLMDGFQRSLTSSSSNNNNNSSNKEPPTMCLSYFFPSWKLLNAGQFKGAMIYSFLLAFLTEGLFAIRDVVLQHVVRGRKTILILLYMLQQAMGYLIMLVTMVYSVELFVSVILGLAVGHLMFVRDPDVVKRRRRPPPQQQQQQSQAATPIYSQNQQESIVVNEPTEDLQHQMVNRALEMKEG